MNVQFGGGYQASGPEPEEGDEASVAEPPHAGVLRAAVPGELLACAVRRVDRPPDADAGVLRAAVPCAY